MKVILATQYVKIPDGGKWSYLGLAGGVGSLGGAGQWLMMVRIIPTPIVPSLAVIH
jgi:hypothetical protein